MQTKYSVDLTKDPFFKKLICGETYESKETLRLMIESFIQRKVRDVMTMPNEPVNDSKYSKNTRMDVVAALEDGTRINVEMQAFNKLDDLSCRLEYHASRLVQTQKAIGELYQDINETHVIMYMNFDMFKDDKIYHHFVFMGKFTHIPLAKAKALMNIHTVEMKFKKDYKVEHALNEAEKWGYYLKYYNDETKRDIIEILKKDMEGAYMADLRVKQLSDDDIVGLNKQFDEMWENANSVEAHFNSGMKRGIGIGRDQGIVIGAQKERISAILKLFKKGYTEKDILDLEYTLEEINQAKTI